MLEKETDFDQTYGCFLRRNYTTNYCEKLIVKNYIKEKHRKDGKIYKKNKSKKIKKMRKTVNF